VLIPERHLDGIAAGEVDLAFRRWERPRGRDQALAVGYRLSPRGEKLLETHEGPAMSPGPREDSQP
jgi:hypothetical protein